MEYCPHCLREVDGTYCPYCGGLINWTAAVCQLPVGTILTRADDYSYQIGAAKGQGGFGITYAGMDLQNGRRVAVKEYYPSRCASRTQSYTVHPTAEGAAEYQNGKKAFLEEAMMLSAVGALPSVVTVYDCFETNGTAYLVMEYVDGSPLHEIIARKGIFTAGELLPLLPPLFKDLGILHKAGIIHRDISPDNLILTPQRTLKLLDFGSARSVNTAQNMTVLLKPGFSPVEQYQSTGQGPYTDLYALAGTVYYCLTGTIPPPAFDRMSHDTLQPPNALGAGLTSEQEDAIVWALSVKPEHRPISAEVLANKLFGRRITGPHPPQPPPMPDQGQNWFMRNMLKSSRRTYKIVNWIISKIVSADPRQTNVCTKDTAQRISLAGELLAYFLSVVIVFVYMILIIDDPDMFYDITASFAFLCILAVPFILNLLINFVAYAVENSSE